MLQKVLQNEALDSNVNDKELEQFITGLHGDLRRGLTELQAATASNTSLLRQSQMLLKPYEKILELVNTNQHENALSEVHKLIYNTIDMKTLCVNLHDVIVESSMEHTRKFKLLRVVGEAEWRSSSMTPKVLASWMIGQMI